MPPTSSTGLDGSPIRCDDSVKSAFSAFLSRQRHLLIHHLHIASFKSDNTGVMWMQIRLFYPEALHPAFGVVRAIVKDSTDTETGDSAVVFLDSDGLVRGPILAVALSNFCSIPVQDT